MYCDKCVHKAEIEALFRECQDCASHGPSCASCPTYLSKEQEFKKIDHFCQECQAGQLHNEIHFNGAEGGLQAVISKAGGIAIQELERRFSNNNATGVTSLDPDCEDKLRIVLSSIMGLKPLELLLVHHIFQRRTMSSFRETLRELRDRLTNRYDLRDVDENGKTVTSFRSIVSLWGQRIVKKVPALADVFAANKAETTCSK